MMKSATEFGPAAEHLRSAFKDSSPVESAKFFRDVKAAADQDLAGTIAWMSQQYGLHPLQLAQQIAHRFGNQPAQQQSHAQAVAAVEAEIERTSKTLENFDRYEDDILDVLNGKQFKRTGNAGADLRSAYREAVKRDAKLSRDERIDKTLRRAYDKANSTRGA